MFLLFTSHATVDHAHPRGQNKRSTEKSTNQYVHLDRVLSQIQEVASVVQQISDIFVVHLNQDGLASVGGVGGTGEGWSFRAFLGLIRSTCTMFPLYVGAWWVRGRGEQ